MPLPGDSSSDAPGRLTAALHDRYRFERELGQGGMATVYLAHDLKHGRKVAIKVLRPELSAAIGSERFLAEIRTTAQLQHPHILGLIDSGTIEPEAAHPSPLASRLLYYVMPFVEGESLRHRLTRDTQLPLEDALRLTREVAGALEFAHKRGVVHRDIKPENILLQDGQALVADFGIALAVATPDDHRVTTVGTSIGSPVYMSPEQALAERTIDHRTDIYSLGAVLFEMLAGSPPFTGTTAHAITATKLTEPVPTLTAARRDVPASVDHAIARTLARNPAERFATMAEFATALSGPTSVRPRPAHRANTRRRAWVAGAAVLATGGIAGWLMWSRQPPVAPSSSVIAVMPFLPSSPDSALTRLGRDLALTISANLDGVGGIRTADPRIVLAKAGRSAASLAASDAIAVGKELGAGRVVIGDIVPVGSDVRLDLKLLDTEGSPEPLARASFTNTPDSISALTDSVTWALLRQVWRRGTPPSPSYATLTTRSVPALRAFLDGEQLSEIGRYPEAVESYRTAIEADSTFWLAGWRYNMAQAWLLEAAPDPVLQKGYESHLAAFGERDRLLIETEMAEPRQTTAEHLAALRALTQRFPNDWTVWFHYGDHLYHVAGLAGMSHAETVAALKRTVDLNPRLLAIWDHLYGATLGRDSAQALQARQAILQLRDYDDQARRWEFDSRLFGRMMAAAERGDPAVQLVDSVATGLARSSVWLPRVLGNYFLLLGGFPAAQLDVNRRRLAVDPRTDLIAFTWKGNALSWAARGAWDSALVDMDRYAAAGQPGIAAVERYSFAVTGAWLGPLDSAEAIARRSAAVQGVERLPPDSAVTRHASAILAWADGMLGVLQRDGGAIGRARQALRQLGTPRARYMERSLAAFEQQLGGSRRQAADSLEALDLAAKMDSVLGDDLAFVRWMPHTRSINHLMGARLLLSLGDTARAMAMLQWPEANAGRNADYQPFAPLAYHEMGRIEEARGNTDLARAHYKLFLQRHDMPSPIHRPLVDEATAALRRMAGQNDAPAVR